MFFDVILDSFLSFFSHELAIDLGSENIRIFVKNKGIVVNEPFLGVIDKRNKQIIAFGKEAKKMIGRVPEYVKIVRPISEGTIVDFETTSYLLKKYIEHLHRAYGLLPKIPKPLVMLSFSSNLSSVEKKALIDVVLSAGARKVVTVPRLKAAALGSGINFSSKKGILTVDFGADTTEIGIVSGSGLIQTRFVKIGSRTLNRAIINFIRLKYGVLISEEIAEQVKIVVGLLPSERLRLNEKYFVVRGRDMESSLPRSLKISSSETGEILMPNINIILENLREIIEKSPPEFLADLTDFGIVLVGGGSLLHGLPELIADRLRTNAFVAKDPASAVLRGMALIFENKHMLKSI